MEISDDDRPQKKKSLEDSDKKKERLVNEKVEYSQPMRDSKL